MGFGLLGAGAAVSGAMEGYQKGRKFAIEEEAAEDEKKLRGLKLEKSAQDIELGKTQLESARMQISDAQKAREVRDKIAAVLKKAAEDEAALSAAAPAAPSVPGAPASEPDANGVSVVPVRPAGVSVPAAAPAAAAPAMAAPAGISAPMTDAAAPTKEINAPGLTPPGAAPAAAPAAPAAPRTPMQIRQDAYAKVLNLQMEIPGANHTELMQKALNAAKLFRDARVQQSIGILQDVQSGHMTQEQAFAEMAKNGNPVAPGTQIRVVDVPTYPGVKGLEKFTSKDAQVISPDGKVVTSYSDLLKKTLPTDKLFDAESKIGDLALKSSHYAAIEEQARESAKISMARGEQQHQQAMARLAELAEQNKRTFDLQYDKFRVEKTVQDYALTQRQVDRLYGFNPMTPDQRIKIEREFGPEAVAKEEARQQELLRKTEGTMLIWSMNIDPKTFKPTVTAVEAKDAGRVMLDAVKKPELIKKDEAGRSFVVVGGTRVLVPGGDAPEAPKEAPPAAAPAPAPAAGIAKPNPYVDTKGRPNYDAPRGEPSALTTTVIPGISRAATAVQAAAERHANDMVPSYLRGKIDRGEPLSPSEQVRAAQLGLIKPNPR